MAKVLRGGGGKGVISNNIVTESSHVVFITEVRIEVTTCRTARRCV